MSNNTTSKIASIPAAQIEVIEVSAPCRTLGDLWNAKNYGAELRDAEFRIAMEQVTAARVGAMLKNLETFAILEDQIAFHNAYAGKCGAALMEAYTRKCIESIYKGGHR